MDGTGVTEGESAVQPTLAGLADRAPTGPGGSRRRRAAGPTALAADLPVAQVVVDRSQPHLDRVFEYAVPQTLSAAASPGVRVKVRFSGQDLDGYVVARADVASHEGALTPLRRVVSPEVVLQPAVLATARAVARRYAGTLPDVLRLAVPPRHARVEQEEWPAPEDSTGEVAPTAPMAEVTQPAPGWDAWTGGPAFLRRLAAGEAPRAVWQALPGQDGDTWADALAHAVRAARAGGRGALVVLPSAAEVTVMAEALVAAGVAPWAPGALGGWVRLMADDGPAGRYRAFLAASRGLADVVIGTRAAAFAPVRRPGLLACWDDGDQLHAEPRAPYPHTREVLAIRADVEGSALLVGGFARTVATERWLRDGSARPLVAPRETVRTRTPRVRALTAVELAPEGPAAAARLPAPAWRAVRDGLVRGPVLVQVPRAGYVPSTACGTCRALARCTACSGPLEVTAAGRPPRCRWCGRLATDWRCPECSGTALRSVRVGQLRTAEELGRAFPGVPVRVSGASASAGVVAHVGPRPALVVATPGAEPRAEGGYSAGLLLDAAVVTGRAGLDVPEQALRTWLAAAALVRPASDGGVVLLVGDAAPAPTQALVRWDPAWLAERELTERTELSLPPAVHMISVEGPREAVERLLGGLDLPAGTAVLGPLAVVDAPRRVEDAQGVLDPETLRPVRALVRGPWSAAAATTAAVAAALATRSARREPGQLRVQVEPPEVV
ncbi:primosomal protein N' [Actinotalea subterranea]|uniref:primosomal protein N' family DNA-binding protein n=1 Tax=Actinotalea subterranea TaxID=2607497 RepID=UPI0011EC331E|nr:primosomal protein N' [Actinotalea subterranea]